MHVTVDASTCQGHARCHALCPEIFDLDAEGFAQVTADVVPAALEDKVRQAVANCPERAITVDA
jgi:ferredoxin